MADPPEGTKRILQDLARSVALHRRAGGVLDTLPASEQERLQAMKEEDRQFFLQELAKAEAEAAKGRFQEQLSRWRAR